MNTIEIFREIGLLSHLDESAIQTTLLDAQKANLEPSALIYSLPKLIRWFDSEYWWEPNVAGSYVALVHDLADISRGHFQPTKVSVTPNDDEHYIYEYDNEFVLSFELSGKSYRQTLKYRGDALDVSFIDKFNQVLLDSNSQGMYYWIDTHDQTCIVIFLTAHQYIVLREIVGPDLRPWDEIYNMPSDLHM